MFAAVGIVVLLVMVFGGFVITGGALGAVLHALPHRDADHRRRRGRRADHRQFDAAS